MNIFNNQQSISTDNILEYDTDSNVDIHNEQDDGVLVIDVSMDKEEIHKPKGKKKVQ